MNERGTTLVELLLAMVVGSVVLLGVSSLYVATSRFSGQASSQTFLQRQGVFIFEEMARQIRPATDVTPGDCQNGSNSLQVTNSLGQLVRFPWDSTQPTQLNEVLLSANGAVITTVNLLAGSPVPLKVTNFVVKVCSIVATVTMEIQDNAQNSMTFTTALAPRN
jgi:Tfp pilus assembly protein PilV